MQEYVAYPRAATVRVPLTHQFHHPINTFRKHYVALSARPVGTVGMHYSPECVEGDSANFAITEFSEDEMRRPIPQVRSTLRGSASVRRAITPNRKEDRPLMDGSKEQPQMTAGLDLGDKYSYLCLIDQQSGEVMEEGRLRTTPEAFRRRFASEQPMRIAIEAGTHSPWASRVLEECAHEVLVANARKLRLIYARANARPTRSMP